MSSKSAAAGPAWRRHHTSGMPIDPWLPRAAALRPDRIALEAPEGALTYARAARRARGSTPRPAAASRSRCRRGWTSRSRCTPACSPARPRCPSTRGWAEAEQAALLASAVARASTARCPLRRRGATGPGRRRHGAGRPHVRDDGGAAAGRAELREHPGQRARLGRRARPRPRRALAVPAAALARRRADGAAALGDLRHHAPCSTAPSAASDDDITVVSLVPTQLRRLLDAGARPGARLRVVLLGGAAATPDLLGRARAAGWPVAATYGLTQACSQVAVDGRALPGLRGLARRPTARSSSRARPSPAAASCAPATSAASTRPGACTSSAASPTRSSRAARTSRPPRSRPRCSPTPPSPTRASSAARTRSGGRP